MNENQTEHKSLIEQKFLRGIEDHVEESGPRGRKSLGPQNVRYFTAGQQRRAHARSIASNRRKQTKTSWKVYHQRNLAVAILRGQLEAVGVLRTPTRRVRPGDVAVIVPILEKNFESLDKAFEAYIAARGAA